MRDQYRILLVSTAFLVSVILACSGAKILSTYSTGEIMVDGNFQEWENRLTYLENKEINLGVSNDSTAVYFCITIADQGLRHRVFTQGVTLWIDPDGGRSEVFGIRYPIGLPPALKQQMEPDLRNEPMRAIPDYRKWIDQLPRDLMLLVNGEEQATIPISGNARDLELALGFTHGNLIYEGKIPFSELGDIPVSELASGTQVGFGLAIPAQPVRKRSGNRNVGGQSGAVGSPATGSPTGGIAGRGNRLNRQLADDFEHWSSVQLASAGD